MCVCVCVRVCVCCVLLFAARVAGCTCVLVWGPHDSDYPHCHSEVTVDMLSARHKTLARTLIFILRDYQGVNYSYANRKLFVRDVIRGHTKARAEYRDGPSHRIASHQIASRRIVSRRVARRVAMCAFRYTRGANVVASRDSIAQRRRGIESRDGPSHRTESCRVASRRVASHNIASAQHSIARVGTDQKARTCYAMLCYAMLGPSREHNVRQPHAIVS